MDTLRNQLDLEASRRRAPKRAAAFKLDPELIAAIEREAIRLGVTKGAVVRAALNLVLLAGGIGEI